MSTGRRGRGHTVGERGAAQGGGREDGVAVGRGCPGFVAAAAGATEGSDPSDEVPALSGDLTNQL